MPLIFATTVDVKPANDLLEISHKAGVPEGMEGCHTMAAT
jgi:hypothetical protein